MDLRTKSKRLCDKLKTRNPVQKKVASGKGKHSNIKIKSKKPCQNTISMIKFYESIPSYEEIRHLPDYDFTEQLSLLKKIHCDLSQPLAHRIHCEASKSAGSCRRKTSVKKKRDSPLKRNTISPSLCRTFSKTSLNDLEDIGSGNRNQTGRLPSVDSIPSPIKRLQLLRERLSASVNLHHHHHDFKSEKLKRPSPMCSSRFSELKLDYSPHRHEVESHPCDLYFNNCHSNIGMDCKFSVSSIENPPKQMRNVEEQNESFRNATSPPSIDLMKRRRAKSCPKELFSTSKPCLNFQTDDNILNSSSTKQHHDESTPSQNPGDCNSSVSSRPRHKSKKPKSKTPNSFDDFLSSKMVRSNLAANLRQKWARKKINDMTEEKLKATVPVAKCIPKCHRWNVRNTSAWKSFTAEDTQTEKRLREAARREEQMLRQHAHAMHMNIMRARVGSAQLLLEGRALSAKS